MNKELIDRVWACLPREFKEKVKKEYYHDDTNPFELAQLEAIFGIHNLISDAEGDELLTCEKSKAMQLYSHLLDLVENERISEHYSEWCDLEREYIALFGENVFADYFGSKCLPDAHEVNFTSIEPKPAETKNEGTHQEQCVPKNAESGTHSFSHILKDSFRNHNRLHIAAMAMQGILSNADRMKKYQYVATKPPCTELAVVVARKALRYADVLIAECKKGDNHA